MNFNDEVASVCKNELIVYGHIFFNYSGCKNLRQDFCKEFLILPYYSKNPLIP